MSLVEAFANVAVDYWVAVTTQVLMFPLSGLATILVDNMAIGVVSTVMSVARSFAPGSLFKVAISRIASKLP